MPGLPKRNDQFSNGSSAMYSTTTNGFWSKHRDDISYNQLQKFWSELSLQARQELLRVDKQTLFEQARKNMYCSRCNGLLLEGFLQIVMYGKSLQQEGTNGHVASNRNGTVRNHNYGGSRVINEDEIQDPSVHPWGALTTTRDGSLTLMDCYLYSRSLKGLQTVFDSARARERERELLYPDACGGGGRGWISQGLASYGRGHGTRETCALHTARLSCDTLVDFWSALGEETRQSLLRMKEEDFIERLMYRFDSKRFCRDCRRNVIREFKELKELKRMRREPRCTGWFCVADTAFQYEVSADSIQADWRQTFSDTVGMYHHFEWAVGTSEGKCDILEFENIGMNGSVQVNGLDLSGFGACFITLRAYKSDGRCTEISVKAHALKGQQCVHGRLVVGDGYVTITKGESIRRFFEHAEEAEEEEDDDSMDKDGNELDGECSRPQKHAKSPELAREFLLDAATVIFKEQVEKAFREGTARQNAHSIFVCLALKLLEDRVHVACKEIITLEKQKKLLEEEEKEKRDEEERKERRRTKEREKKLRRKERLKGKEKDKEKKCSELSEISCSPEVSKEDTCATVNEEQINTISREDSIDEMADTNTCDIQDEESSNDCGAMRTQSYYYDGDNNHSKDEAGNFTVEQSRFPHRKLKYAKDAHLDVSLKWPDRRKYAVSENGPVSSRSEARHTGLNRQLRTNMLKTNARNCGTKFYYSGSRMNDRYDSHLCSCSQSNEYRVKLEPYSSVIRHGREPKSVNKSESAADTSKQFHRGCKYNLFDHAYESCGRPKPRLLGNNQSRDQLHSKKVWEPLESQKKYPRSISDSDVTLRSSTFKVEAGSGNSTMNSSAEIGFGDSGGLAGNDLDHTLKESRGTSASCQINFQTGAEVSSISTEVASTSSTLNVAAGLTTSSTSNSDNCSSYLSEGDSIAASNHANMESPSTSDSEDASQQSEGRETSAGSQNAFSECHEFGTEKIQKTNRVEEAAESMQNDPSSEEGSGVSRTPAITISQNLENGSSAAASHQPLFPLTRGLQFRMFQAPSTMGYYQHNPVSWPAAPANGLMHFPHPNHYVYTAPLGYGVNDNSSFCMHYGDLQHLTTPVFSPAAVPVYPPVGQGSNVDGQPNGFRLPSRKERTKGVAELPSEVLSNKPVSNEKVGQKDHSSESQANSNSFSLFHFGGPVALSTANAVNSAPSKGGTDGDPTRRNSADNLEYNRDCKETATMEEYSLFAANDRLKFFNFLKG